jgi:hypothetical protein
VIFTREPIILSVITPKEGSKLVLRNTYLEEQEDYFIDALEVVSFEGAIFYRSLERPKSFLVPVHSYEVLEVKEARMVLKSLTHEKAIKIGGGAKPQLPEEKKADKLKERKRSKRRKPPSLSVSVPESIKKEEEGQVSKEKEGLVEETPSPPPSVFKKIFPPPNTLIKEKLARYKNEEFFEENILPLVEEESAGDKGSAISENKDLHEKNIDENLDGRKESSSDSGEKKDEGDFTLSDE